MLQPYVCSLPFGQGQVPILRNEEIQEDKAQFIRPSDILRLIPHGYRGGMHAMRQGDGYTSQEKDTENKKGKKRHFSRDGKSSEQFVWRNLVYRCVWVNKLSTGI